MKASQNRFTRADLRNKIIGMNIVLQSHGHADLLAVQGHNGYTGLDVITPNGGGGSSTLATGTPTQCYIAALEYYSLMLMAIAQNYKKSL